MKGLGIGRIVHFYPPTVDQTAGEPQAAIVTRLHEQDGYIDVTAFPNGNTFQQVPHSKSPAPYSWCWPPKIE